MKLKSLEECELLLVENGWEKLEGGMWHKGNLYGFSESLLTDSSDYCKDTFLAKFCPFLLEDEDCQEAEEAHLANEEESKAETWRDVTPEGKRGVVWFDSRPDLSVELETWRAEAGRLDDLCLSHERLNAELQAKLVSRGNKIIKLKRLVTDRGETIRSLQNVIAAKDELIAKKELSRKEWREVAIHYIRGGK